LKYFVLKPLNLPFVADMVNHQLFISSSSILNIEAQRIIVENSRIAIKNAFENGKSKAFIDELMRKHAENLRILEGME